ncbi:MAG: biotin--[acetyl-CoA-carboxylase] ligase [Verrucomicrobiota bacterium]
MELSAQAIQASLRVGRHTLDEMTPWPGEIRVVRDTGSTNDDVARWGRDGARAGFCLFAEHQRNGRGRSGSAWASAVGKNLTFSLLLRPKMELERWPTLAHAMALGVSRGVDPWLGGVRSQVKWPNDVFADGRKLAGILVEAHPAKKDPFVVVGVGVNVNAVPEDFPAELRPHVTSVRNFQGGRKLDRNEVAGAVLAELGRQAERCEEEFGNQLSDLRDRSLLLGERVTIWQGDERWQGLAVGLGERGELVVERDSGETERVISADRVRMASYI